MWQSIHSKRHLLPAKELFIDHDFVPAGSSFPQVPHLLSYFIINCLKFPILVPVNHKKSAAFGSEGVSVSKRYTITKNQYNYLKFYLLKYLFTLFALFALPGLRIMILRPRLALLQGETLTHPLLRSYISLRSEPILLFIPLLRDTRLINLRRSLPERLSRPVRVIISILFRCL